MTLSAPGVSSSTASASRSGTASVPVTNSPILTTSPGATVTSELVPAVLPAARMVVCAMSEPQECVAAGADAFHRHAAVAGQHGSVAALAAVAVQYVDDRIPGGLVAARLGRRLRPGHGRRLRLHRRLDGRLCSPEPGQPGERCKVADGAADL